MRKRIATAVLCGAALLATSPARSWSLVEEVALQDLNLSAEMVWEVSDAKAYCESLPPNLDRLACAVRQDEEFWLGVDAAGDRYGTLNGTTSSGTTFDIYRRPRGTGDSQLIARITKRDEIVFGQPVKMFITEGWQVDAVHGELLLGLRGQCLTPDCFAESDTEEHFGLVRISGLPPLLDIVLTYEPQALISFTVPVHPEGLPAGERFDLYAGDTATLPDLGQAVPLACDTSAGHGPGRRIRIPDTTPLPAAGNATYFLAAVGHGAQQRAGRMSGLDGLLGRPADSLPPCSTP